MPTLVYLTNQTTSDLRDAPCEVTDELVSQAKLVRSKHGWALRVDDGPWAGTFIGWFDDAHQPRRAWSWIMRIPGAYRVCHRLIGDAQETAPHRGPQTRFP